jgi:clan AA aspartic protease
MISGIVNMNGEATVSLRVHGPNKQERDIEAVIDTGFNGFLTLPPILIEALGLHRIGRGRAIMANGGEELFDIYGGTVIWDGNPRNIELDAADTTPLVGMSLLYGSDLWMRVIESGPVTIEAVQDNFV